MKKRIFAVLAAATVLATSFSAMAEYDPNKVYDTPQIATKMIDAPASSVEAPYTITVNHQAILAPTPFEKDGLLMLPLRAITEKLGFSVEWQGETHTIILTKGPLYITMNALEDGYTFSKTAPMLLGTAPVLDNGVTYVPDTFITQILGGAYKIAENNVVEVFDSERANVALIETIDAENKQITVNDITKGQVVLNISDETIIWAEDATPFKFEDLKDGMTVKIAYGEAMTMSLPPQNTPVSLTVLSSSPAMPIIAPAEDVVITPVAPEVPEEK